MAILANSGAGTDAKLERNEPIGVLAALNITVSLMLLFRGLAVEKLRLMFMEASPLISKTDMA